MNFYLLTSVNIFIYDKKCVLLDDVEMGFEPTSAFIYFSDIFLIIIY